MSKGLICVSGKKVYLSDLLAEDALIEARIQFDYGNGRGPVGIYRCDDCGYFHLTSQGTMNEKLKSMMTSGAIDKQKQANHWLQKFKYK